VSQSLQTYIRSLRPVSFKMLPTRRRSEAQVCDMWAPAQILAMVWTFGAVTSHVRISGKACPEGEGQLPQRAFISRRASHLPGLDWQSKARKDRASQGNLGLDEVCLRHTQRIGLTLLLPRRFHHHPEVVKKQYPESAKREEFT
jgi:hypothetical protein